MYPLFFRTGNNHAWIIFLELEKSVTCSSMAVEILNSEQLDFSCLKLVTLIQVQHIVSVSGWR